MQTKILITLGLICSVAGYSQKVLIGYSAPQTVVDGSSIRMLPGFHANSNDGSYNGSNNKFVAKIGNPTTETVLPSSTVGNNSASLTENYIYTRNYLVPVNSSNANAPQAQSITYFDGLGRPKQNIAIKSSPFGEDLAQDIPYDPYGRQVDSWLSAPMSTLNGNIQSNVKSSANTFYGDPNGINDSSPFSHTTLDDSPLNRVMRQTAPGSAWQNKPQTYVYDTNINDNVKNFITTTAWTDNVATTTFVTNEIYADKELFKTKAKDEDDNEIITFTNKKGQTILQRRYTVANGNIDTYYIYNEYDQMSYIIPPLAVEEIDGGKTLSTVLDNLCYQYKYDYKNRLVEKKLPGKGWEYIAYNKYDRPVLYQDINLRQGNSGTAQDSWIFTKYDNLGRVIYTGITNDSRSRKDIQSSLDTQTVTSETRKGPTQGAGLTVLAFALHYTNVSYPTTISTLLSVNYYDTYPTLSPPPSIPAYIRNQKVLTNTYAASEYNSDAKISTKGLPTASFLRNIEDNRWTKSYMFYDLEGRQIGTYTTNHLNGYTNGESVLDFSGKVLETYTSHKRNVNATEVKIKERFEYSPQQYLVKHYHQVDNEPEELLTENEYDRIGQLKNKKVGNNLQKIDYKYNIRGWLKEINDVSNIGNDLFAYKIHYQDPEQTADNPYTNYKKYNGNITEVQWKYANNTELRKYYYKYDEIDRLRESKYRKINTNVITPDTYNESMEYDKNGNITKLDRFGLVGKFNTPAKTDELEYFYKDGVNATNKLFKIIDHTQNGSGYYGNGGVNSYDDNGNMTMMPDKAITQPIVYNILNLPTLIRNYDETFQNEVVNTQNVYRADGTKLYKKFRYVGSQEFIITEYLDGFQYVSPITAGLKMAMESDDPSVVRAAKAGQTEVFESEEREPVEQLGPIGGPVTMDLQFFPTTEGFYDYVNKTYIYQYKDQVGNNRVSFSRNKLTNAVEGKDTNDYYPLGLNHKLPSVTLYDPISIPYNYKFQEQELQETGFYSFKWRNYDPSMGRFFNVDPLSEKYAYQSHYNFSENRMIDGRELEGLERWDPKWSENYVGEGGFWDDVNNILRGNWTLFDWSKKSDDGGSSQKSNGVVSAGPVEEIARDIGDSWVADGNMYEQVTSNTLITRNLDGSDPMYNFILPDDLGGWSQDDTASDGLIWKGCLSCHADNGAFNYAVHNSQENNAGQIASAILTSFLGSRIGSGKAASPTSFDDILSNPKAIWGKSADDVSGILGDGWTKSSLKSGNGWKFTQNNGDGFVSYTTGNSHHPNSVYYKINSGAAGKTKVVGSGYKATSNDKSKIIYGE